MKSITARIEELRTYGPRHPATAAIVRAFDAATENIPETPGVRVAVAAKDRISVNSLTVPAHLVPAFVEALAKDETVAGFAVGDTRNIRCGA